MEDSNFNKKLTNNENEIYQNLKNLNEEFDSLLKKLREKDVKLKWEIERLEEKTKSLALSFKHNQISQDYFSFSTKIIEKKNIENNENYIKNKQKLAIIEERENKTKQESSKLCLKEKELEAKFQHMKNFYSDFLKTKEQFEKNSKSINIAKYSKKESILLQKEKSLIDKENDYYLQNSKLSLVIKKLNFIYDENQNIRNKEIIGENFESSKASLPTIHTFLTKKTNFMT